LKAGEEGTCSETTESHRPESKDTKRATKRLTTTWKKPTTRPRTHRLEKLYPKIGALQLTTRYFEVAASRHKE